MYKNISIFITGMDSYNLPDHHQAVHVHLDQPLVTRSAYRDLPDPEHLTF